MTDDPTTSHHVTPEPQPGPATPGGAPSPAAPPVGRGDATGRARPAGRDPGQAQVGSSGRWLNVLLGVALVVAIGGVAFADRPDHGARLGGDRPWQLPRRLHARRQWPERQLRARRERRRLPGRRAGPAA